MHWYNNAVPLSNAEKSQFNYHVAQNSGGEKLWQMLDTCVIINRTLVNLRMNHLLLNGLCCQWCTNPQSIIWKVMWLITMCMFLVQNVVWGYHEYKDIWDAAIDGLELPCEREPGNPRDQSAVAMAKKRPRCKCHCWPCLQNSPKFPHQNFVLYSILKFYICQPACHKT